MNANLVRLFERWTSGERSLSLYAYAAAALPASALYRMALITSPPLRRRFPALSHSRLAVVSSPLVGGTGKSPLTAHLVRCLSEAGCRTAIVTTGYGRRSSAAITLDDSSAAPDAAVAGDEAVELFRSTNCPVYVGVEPSQVIEQLDSAGGHDWIVFDNGISRAWAGETRVVVLSASDLTQPVRYLPYGRWRTIPEFVRQATCVAITSENEVRIDDSHRARLASWGYHGPVGSFVYRMEGLEPLTAEVPPIPHDRTPVIFSGIARPGRFLHSVRTLGYSPAVYRVFPDHHRYTKRDLDELQASRQETGATWYLTTLKDAVKIDPAWISSTPLYFLRIALHQVDGPEILTVLTRDT